MNRKLVEFLKSLLKSKPADTVKTPQAADGTENSDTAQKAFRAGAAVTFITPIGAYAGNTEKDAIRTRAIEQFHQMGHSHHTSIN